MEIVCIKGLVVEDTTPLPSPINNLSYLGIAGVPEFEQLPIDFLPNNMHLRDILIQGCTQFQGFLESSSGHCLESLHLSNCPSILGLQLQGFTQLRHLSVKGCTGLQSLEGLQSLPNIESLTIGQFSEDLSYFPFFYETTEMGDHLLSSLRALYITGWSRLKSLPQQIQHLTGLESLGIYDFDGMTELPEWFGRLTSLQALYIQRCRELVHLPTANEMQKLVSLRRLWIEQCPILKERCKPGSDSSDSEWHKISHIPDVEIDSKRLTAPLSQD